MTTEMNKNGSIEKGPGNASATLPMVSLPNHKALLEAVVVIMQNHRQMTAAEMNAAVANHLQIPQELLELEDANFTGTEFSYRMRWVRTDLKGKGVLTNPRRGVWNYSEEETLLKHKNA